MKIIVGNRELTATLVQNSSTQALRELLKAGPITINMHDYGSMEKVGGIVNYIRGRRCNGNI